MSHIVYTSHSMVQKTDTSELCNTYRTFGPKYVMLSLSE